MNRHLENGTREQREVFYHEVIHSHYATYCAVPIHTSLLSPLRYLSG